MAFLHKNKPNKRMYPRWEYHWIVMFNKKMKEMEKLPNNGLRKREVFVIMRCVKLQERKLSL